MDVSCKIQGNIHVRLTYKFMCPGNWVHIRNEGFVIKKTIEINFKLIYAYYRHPKITNKGVYLYEKSIK